MRKVSAAELLRVVQDGGEVHQQEQPDFDDVLSKLQELVASHQTSVKQQQNQMQGVVTRLANALEDFKGDGIDLSPIETLVKELIATQKPVAKPNYKFHVERNSRGFITGMTAKTEE